MKLFIVHDKVTAISWAVRVVEQGDNYGQNDVLVHPLDAAEPLVEFYDTRYGHTDYGQFVSRYYLSNILYRESGLCLDGGVSAWTIYDEAMQQVARRLQKDFS